MGSNYQDIREDNRRRYGTEGAQKSGRLAAGLYDDRTHFIFELLQNAEDALKHRGNWQGPRTVVFDLNPGRLTLSHFGKPFDEKNVRSVCDIAASTKNEGSIGRFGLGFKSVYAVTDLPEIHSGEEDFAIEDYVFPKAVAPTPREPEETQIVLPFRPSDTTALSDITTAFRHLGPGALLFLRQINEISWQVDGGPSGFYMRNQPEVLGSNVQRITVIGQETGQPETDQQWLVFHRDVSSEGTTVGRVEIAFSLEEDEGAPGEWRLRSLAKSPLVVFFPTVVESHLGFLVQGPFLTTPSRDNIPPADPWNQHLVQEAACLIVEAMRWMRDASVLNVAALSCLPLDRKRFPEGSRFSPVFDAVLKAFQDEALLPTNSGTYVPARQAKIARGQNLRELMSASQLSALFGQANTAWLSGDITIDKTPEIRNYLVGELGIGEITPDKLLASLTKTFLEAQPDEWLVRLYEFLGSQENAVRRYIATIPFIRLEDGSHVLAHQNGRMQAFLPGLMHTGFPTVRRTVCSTPAARGFLISLGITEPDPVDDVIHNILPKYRQGQPEIDEDAYTADIHRICTAFDTDSKAKREKLCNALKEVPFVRVMNPNDGCSRLTKPGNAYIATDRLKKLFDGVDGVSIVDERYDCLRGGAVRNVLEACGSLRHLRPIQILNGLDWKQMRELRKRSGYEYTSNKSDRVTDYILEGLDKVIELLPTLGKEQRIERSRLLWESLCELQENAGQFIFEGSYTWTHYGDRKSPPFPAAFLRRLNEAAWVSNNEGELLPPRLMVFESLEWKSNPFLLSRIEFKPSVIDELAKAAGIEPAALDLLRKFGLTNVADLEARLGVKSSPETKSDPHKTPEAPEATDGDVYGDAMDLYGADMPDIPAGSFDPEGGDSPIGGIKAGGSGHGAPTNGGHSGQHKGTERARPAGSSGARPFISYVGTHPEDDESDPDGINQESRMALESQAIALILEHEPALLRTPAGNPGFDLYEPDASGQPLRWVEVKAMTGSLDDRPVGLSRTQFDHARQHGTYYWLYIVEHAADPSKARILRIHDPASHARTFTFDHGWRQIAQSEPLSK